MKALAAFLNLITGVAFAQTIVCPPDAPANVKLAAKEMESTQANDGRRPAINTCHP